MRLARECHKLSFHVPKVPNDGRNNVSSPLNRRDLAGNDEEGMTATKNLLPCAVTHKSSAF
jgi:hypothetical protein